jgi:hypothetical protein
VFQPVLQLEDAMAVRQFWAYGQQRNLVVEVIDQMRAHWAQQYDTCSVEDVPVVRAKRAALGEFVEVMNRLAKGDE